MSYNQILFLPFMNTICLWPLKSILYAEEMGIQRDVFSHCPNSTVIPKGSITVWHTQVFMSHKPPA